MAVRSSIILASGKYFFIELVGDILYFPLWWYSAGFRQLLTALGYSVRSTERYLALGLLARSLFLPMFGQYDREGRIISFFMRLAILFGRSVYMLGLLAIDFLLVIVWMGLPVLVVVRLASFFL